MLAAKSKDFIPGSELLIEFVFFEIKLSSGVDFCDQPKAFNHTDVLSMHFDQSSVELFFAQYPILTPKLSVHFVADSGMNFGFSGFVNYLQNAGNRKQGARCASEYSIAVWNRACCGSEANQSYEGKSQISIASKVFVSAKKAHGIAKFPCDVGGCSLVSLVEFHSASSCIKGDLVLVLEVGFLVCGLECTRDQDLLVYLGVRRTSCPWMLLFFRGGLWLTPLSLIHVLKDRSPFDGHAVGDVKNAA